jgi:indolepyruvate ferredoxin oxidoreductase alpha subunit
MKELLTGNEAIARGAYEAGIMFASAYPGTPSTEILENTALYKEIYSEWAPNEKVALESCIGASVAGARALCAMKHVGVNVAADPLMTFTYTGVTGGFALISADDPGAHSSQNEQDNRYYAKFAKMPCLEPSDSAECKDFVALAMEISERFDTPVMLRLTTRICHSKSLVELCERTEPEKKPYVKNIAKYTPVPASVRGTRLKLDERMSRLTEYSNATGINAIQYGRDREIGIISSGVAYQYAREVFGEDANYFKLGLTFPLPIEKIKEFAESVKTLYIVEELEPFIEEQLLAAGISCEGKTKIPAIGELNPDIVAKGLLGKETEIIAYDRSKLAQRPPVLCAGCPHRGFFFELSKRKDIVISSDIGCYALSAAPPLNAKDLANCMGASFSMAHGMQKIFDRYGEKKKTVAVLGDSTFFHSGMTSLLTAIYNKSSAVFVILDNRITGMTGHQENPGTGFTLMGEETELTDVEEVVRALGARNVRTVNPLIVSEMREVMNWALDCGEVAVVITKWPCVLKRLSERDKADFGDYKGRCEVNPDICIGCKMCTKTGCPALVYIEKAKKVEIDENQCVGCELCVQVCPVKAIERVK